MKQFLKYVLATIIGLVVFGIIMSIISVVTLVGMASMSSGGGNISENSVLVVKLDGELSERSEDNPLSSLLGSASPSKLGLEDIIAAIKRAETEDDIKGIYLEAGSLTSTPAAIEELHDALIAFKKSGKFIVSYGDNYSQGTYYLCSTADSVLINPSGMLDWKGLAMQTLYFKDLMDKAGVKMQVFKVGTYKSAVEPYLLSEISEANKEQISVFSGEIWDVITKDVAKNRKLTAETLNQYADSGIFVNDAKDYKKLKLVDKLAYSDEVPSVISNMMDVDQNDYNTITVSTLAGIAQSEPKGTSGNIIAVYYAEGDIVQAPSASNIGGNNAEIVGEKVIDDLKKLAEDEDVKAVVLRVNSPGGSAYASEQIWHQVMNIKSKKPIIVSMGGYAASGGYYISCAADWIVAEPTTLTGSIGIFGMFPEAEELLNKKLGLHASVVKTNEYADMGGYFRPMNEGEKSLLQGYINRGYELFTKRCADGRKMKQDDIKAIAEGRVWTGIHAKQIGLVDQLGSLKDAIVVAQKKAKVSEYTIMTYPAKASMLDNLFKEVSGDSYADRKMRETFGEYYNIFSNMKSITNKTGIQASLPYYLMFNM